MSWLALNVGPLIAGLIIFFVVRKAFNWASAGPGGALLLMATTWLIVQGARIFFVPTVDVAYVDVRDQVRESQIGADAARFLSAAPQDLGFSGEGAQSALFPSAGEAPTVVFVTPEPSSGPATSDVGGGLATTGFTTMEFAIPAVVTARQSTLTLISGSSMRVIDTTGIPLAACGWDMTKGYGADGRPLYLLACPASEGTVFPLFEVFLSADFPLPPAVQALSQPSSTTPPIDVGECWLKWASDVSFSTVTERMGAQALPIGTTWRLAGPGDWQTAWHIAVNEVWHLTSEPIGVIDFPVTGSWARSLPNSDDSATVVVKGTGNFCQP